jgi:hypothetical protein
VQDPEFNLQYCQTQGKGRKEGRREEGREGGGREERGKERKRKEKKERKKEKESLSLHFCLLCIQKFEESPEQYRRRTWAPPSLTPGQASQGLPPLYQVVE